MKSPEVGQVERVAIRLDVCFSFPSRRGARGSAVRSDSRARSSRGRHQSSRFSVGCRRRAGRRLGGCRRSYDRADDALEVPQRHGVRFLVVGCTTVVDQEGRVSQVRAVPGGEVDAPVGRQPADQQLADAEVAQQPVDGGRVERAAACLVQDRFAWPRRNLAGEVVPLPPIWSSRSPLPRRSRRMFRCRCGGRSRPSVRAGPVVMWITGGAWRRGRPAR
jgi:hypothetical protein